MDDVDEEVRAAAHHVDEVDEGARATWRATACYPATVTSTAPGAVWIAYDG